MKIIADQNIPFVGECFRSIGQVELHPGRQITPSTLRGADVLLVRSITKVDESLLAGSSIKFAGTATIGVDHIDQDYLRRAGIGFASAPGSNAVSVAEYVTAALLALGKKHKLTLEGRSIGIIGVGNVGSRVAARCAALGMRVVLNDPPLERQTGDAKYRPLEEALACDFLTLHTPLTKTGPDATYHLADEAFFARMKPGAFFLNTARGGVMDTAALKAAMAAGRLGGVVLDVWEGEPNPDPELILRVDLSTPHIAGYSFDGKVRGMVMLYNAVCDYFGLPKEFGEHDFLPEPLVPRLHVSREESEQTPQERLIHDLVQKVYPINRDDFNMRELLLIDPEKRGPFFDDLRKNYPVRREFAGTTILLPEGHDELRRKLSGIGFKTEKGSGAFSVPEIGQ